MQHFGLRTQICDVEAGVWYLSRVKHLAGFIPVIRVWSGVQHLTEVRMWAWRLCRSLKSLTDCVFTLFIILSPVSLLTIATCMNHFHKCNMQCSSQTFKFHIHGFEGNFVGPVQGCVKIWLRAGFLPLVIEVSQPKTKLNYDDLRELMAHRTLKYSSKELIMVL